MQRRHFLIALAAWRGLLPGPAAAVDFAPVLPGRRLVFPDDFGAHPDFRTEWWYATGWLADPARPGEPTHGFQVTFFRSRTALAQRQPPHPSAFAARQLIFADEFEAASLDRQVVGCSQAAYQVLQGGGRDAPDGGPLCDYRAHELRALW